jgi:hypothetical protein
VRLPFCTTMQTYNDLIELVRICRAQAAGTTNPEVAGELIRIADEYENRATAIWIYEQRYCEFFPRTVLERSRKRPS